MLTSPVNNTLKTVERKQELDQVSRHSLREDESVWSDENQRKSVSHGSQRDAQNPQGEEEIKEENKESEL